MKEALDGTLHKKEVVETKPAANVTEPTNALAGNVTSSAVDS
jgi:hypothetical protein